MRREYKRGSLDSKDLQPHPATLFRTWFEEGKSAVVEPNAMALATADKNGQPSVRMVLMKGFDHDSFLFATNYESRKAMEILENPKAALLFYWPTLERQVRIAGSIFKASAEDSDSIFMSRPKNSRLAAIISKQSAPVASREILEAALQLEIDKTENQEVFRPRNWGGFRLQATEFEFWQGRENRLHDRFLYTKHGDRWDTVRLQP